MAKIMFNLTGTGASVEVSIEHGDPAVIARIEQGFPMLRVAKQALREAILEAGGGDMIQRAQRVAGAPPKRCQGCPD